MKDTATFTLAEIKSALKASSVRDEAHCYDIEMSSEFFFNQLWRKRVGNISKIKSVKLKRAHK